MRCNMEKWNRLRLGTFVVIGAQLLCAGGCGNETAGEAGLSHSVRDDAPKKTTGQLRLLEAAGPVGRKTEPALAGTSWVWPGTRKHTGEGFGRLLIFEGQRDGDQLIVRRGSISYSKVGFPRRNLQTSLVSLPCRIRGPVLFIGDEAHTFVLTKQSLILDAVVPLGAGRWYYAYTERRNGGKIRWREYLYEFEDDPFEQDKGRAVVHGRIGGKVVRSGASFSVKPDSPTLCRRVSFTSDNAGAGNPSVLDLVLVAKRVYAAPESFSRPRVYKAAEVHLKTVTEVNYELKRQ